MVANPATAIATSPVTVRLEQLKSGKSHDCAFVTSPCFLRIEIGSVPFQTLEEAFGPSSLGIIIVRDLPAAFTELRSRLLSYASYLGNLSEDELATLESPASKWLVGWSCGKETLKDGRHDTLKGSYYVNPVQNSTLEAEARKRYPNLPEYTAPNVWPAEALLPGFRQTFQDLCDLIISTAVLVAQACDRYAAQNVDGYEDGYLEHVVRTSVSTKARLLHYFPSSATASSGGADSPQEEGDVDDDWCATHLDHGCLTGLTSAMFVDESEQRPADALANASGAMDPWSEIACPDPKAGLYIHSRSGQVAKVSIPRDCLAFQTGEALEVITKGKFRAVPHFVRGVGKEVGGRVARNTLAVFTQPNLWEKVDSERDFATFAREIVEKNH